jgi:hypothetical protein
MYMIGVRVHRDDKIVFLFSHPEMRVIKKEKEKYLRTHKYHLVDIFWRDDRVSVASMYTSNTYLANNQQVRHRIPFRRRTW